jgi:hypothetical protein
VSPNFRGARWDISSAGQQVEVFEGSYDARKIVVFEFHWDRLNRRNMWRRSILTTECVPNALAVRHWICEGPA